MSKIVNLKQARKQWDRAAKEADGTANATRHGRTKAERLAEDKVATKTEKHLDDHKRDKP
ncbi:MAG: DUF4169 family protein [Paracoccaceae bacterium]|nr:DUF4169 family protein [Paracoccaceae bacterium]MDG1370575.1 DUF4169 family protein [Paracoccaceae bacterium]